MLYYNIYKNISDKQYQKLETRLSILQLGIAQIVNSNRFTPIIDKKDGLGIGFEEKGGRIRGGFGISPDDLPGKITLSMGLIKCIDKENKRYLKKEDLHKNVSIDEIEKNYLTWIPKLIIVYDSWKESDLVESVEFKLLR